MHLRRIAARSTAFTLIELLVVVSIIAILAALVLPVLGRVQMRGYETKTLSNMRVMGTALMAYAGDNSFQVPARVNATDGTAANKWPLLLQPYIGDLSVYGSPIPDVGGKTYKVTDPQLYLHNDTNYTSYIYNGMNDVVPYGVNGTPPRLNTLSQPSQTILLGVPLPQKDNFYMDFYEKNESTILNKQAFIDGTPYVFADGSARTLIVDPKASNTAQPASSGTYSDWLWLFDKSQTSVIN